MQVQCTWGYLVLAVLAAASAGVLLLAVNAEPAAAAYYKHCGDQNGPGAGWYDARAHNVGCETARYVARRHTRDGDERFDGWRCEDEQTGYEQFKAVCHRNRDGRYQEVKFRFGS